MDFQIATLCDHAADYQGKMVLSGTFDSLAGRNMPLTHPTCSLALRICMTPEDNGKHTLLISIIDEDGHAVNPKMPIKADLPVEIPEKISFVTRNMILNFQGLRFEQAGVYSVDIHLDDELAVRLPIRILQVDSKGRPIQNA